MSLVSYAASSDEDSESEHEDMIVENGKPSSLMSTLTGHISDDDDDFSQIGDSLQELKKSTLSLPAPKRKEMIKTVNEEFDENILPTFSKLPMPRSTHENNKVVELDDEFLHKKAFPAYDDKKEKPPLLPIPSKGPVKITIPSLKDFSDVDVDLAKRGKNKTETVKKPKGSGLLSVLPKAKSEQDFSRATDTTSKIEKQNLKKISALIPDSVKHLRPARNTEDVDGVKLKLLKPTNKKEKLKQSLVAFSDSDGDVSDNDDGDFFSLNADVKLPEISPNEINIMVAKRAAKMAEATNKFLESKTAAAAATTTVEDDAATEEEMRFAQKRFHEQQLDAQAMQALVGSSAKRRRKQHDEIQVMNISGDQVLPNRDEWMRTALATSTAYQPTGVLVDEEPASGTRRKHQITYLAHKAKANEAELQAMWAANRNTRRATQSKYGF